MYVYYIVIIPKCNVISIFRCAKWNEKRQISVYHLIQACFGTAFFLFFFRFNNPYRSKGVNYGKKLC